MVEINISFPPIFHSLNLIFIIHPPFIFLTLLSRLDILFCLSDPLYPHPLLLQWYYIPSLNRFGTYWLVSFLPHPTMVKFITIIKIKNRLINLFILSLLNVLKFFYNTLFHCFQIPWNENILYLCNNMLHNCLGFVNRVHMFVAFCYVGYP